MSTPPFFSLLVLVGLAAAAGPALALDVGEAAPPQAIADRQLTIGTRSLKLPAGDWIFIAKYTGAMTRNSMKSTTTHLAYAANVRDKALRAGVALQLPMSSAQVNDWKDQPCKVQGALFKDEFGNNVNQPECLLVFKRRAHLKGTSGDFYPQAQGWIEAEGVKLPGPVYEVAYFKYASNDFGWVRLFIPEAAVASEADMVEWAKKLPAELLPFFENRRSTATLPELPTAPPPPKPGN